MARGYFEYRNQVYASINGTKGNLTKLSKSKLLKKDELVKLMEVIDALENLRVVYKNNMEGKKNTINENIITVDEFLLREQLRNIKIDNDICPLCRNTGEYSYGGSFGGGVITQNCICGKEKELINKTNI